MPAERSNSSVIHSKRIGKSRLEIGSSGQTSINDLVGPTSSGPSFSRRPRAHLISLLAKPQNETRSETCQLAGIVSRAYICATLLALGELSYFVAFYIPDLKGLLLTLGVLLTGCSLGAMCTLCHWFWGVDLDDGFNNKEQSILGGFDYVVRMVALEAQTYGAKMAYIRKPPISRCPRNGRQLN